MARLVKEQRLMDFNALSLFSSAGLAETYFERHGVHVRVACELLPERARFYSAIYPDVDMVVGDLTNRDTFDDVMDRAHMNGCDFLLATPPCQGMSSAGTKKKDDPRNRLIIQVVDAIHELHPLFVIIENVPDILQTSILVDGNWLLIDDYLHVELGNEYRFNERKVVNAMNYGVAQSRERCIYLLSRIDQNVAWEFPEPSEHVTTMRDAIGNLPSLDPFVSDIPKEQFNALFPDFDAKKEAGRAVSKWHCPPTHLYRHVIAMQHTPEGHSAWSNVLFYPKLADGSKGKGYKNTYKRQWWDRPAYTVTRYTSRIGSQENGHPGRPIVDSPDERERIWSDPRIMTVFELMRLSSLPDDWPVPDWAGHNLVREILGEGVPPRLLEHALISLEGIIDE